MEGRAMDGQAETIDEYRAWLQAKDDASVTQVRITTAIKSLPDPRVVMEYELREHAEDDPVEYGSGTYGAGSATVTVKGRLVGTAEAAAILRVERPRIGRWRALGNKLPEPIAELAAGPVWLRSDIEALVAETDARRKPRKAAEPA